MRLVGVHPLADGLVDLARGQRTALGERAPRDDRLRDRVGRVVALVGHADQVVAEAERVDDLGRRGQQGDDLHAGKSRRRSPSCRSATRSVSARPAVGAVHHAMVERQRERARGPGHDLAVHDQRARLDDPHRDRYGVARVQQRRSRLGAVAPGVADADRGAPAGRPACRCPPRAASASRSDLRGDRRDPERLRVPAAPAPSARARCPMATPTCTDRNVGCRRRATRR